ncbi:MAG: hypothetical protein HY559_03015 [Gammaproteobacteria bacterium]|nr:hypothetical protein [Gammaproteobacteria bacterium]
MKRILFLLFLVVIGVATFLLYKEHSVLSISYGKWLLQVPVWITLGGIVATGLLTVLLGKGVKAVRALKTSFHAWRTEKRNKAAQYRLLQGFARLVAEEWEKAISLFNNHPPDLSFFAHLGHLYAAYQKKDSEQQEHYFQALVTEYPFLKSTLYLFLAKCQYANGETFDARRSLQQVRVGEVPSAFQKKVHEITEKHLAHNGPS